MRREKKKKGFAPKLPEHQENACGWCGQLCRLCRRLLVGHLLKEDTLVFESPSKEVREKKNNNNSNNNKKKHK